MEASGGAKPLIDAEVMAKALEALDWNVTESVKGELFTGRNDVWSALGWLGSQLKSKFDVKSGSYDIENPGQVAVEGSGHRSPMSIARVFFADKKTLGDLKRTLAKHETVTEAGKLGVTIGKTYTERSSGKYFLEVRIWINLRQWSIQNPRMKGPKKKPVFLTQGYKGIKPLPVTGMKAGQFWNGLYSRGLQNEATTYLESQGKDLPSAEDLASPEEKVRRSFDQEIRKVLLANTEKQVKAVAERVEEWLTQRLDYFFAKQDEKYQEWKDADSKRDFYWPRKKDDKMAVFWDEIKPLLESVREHDGVYQATLYKKKKGLSLKKRAEETAESIRQGFVNKNTLKLSVILMTKGNLEKIVTKGWSNANFEGTMSLFFKDGSSFDVRNKTVTKVSNRGTWFAQYPTTFHNAVLPDGTRMRGSLSEKTMVKEFAEA